MARPDIDPYSPAVDLRDYEPVRRVQAGKAGAGFFSRNGTHFFARYDAVGPAGWGILVEQPVPILRQALWVVEKRAWLLAIVLVALACGALMVSVYKQLEVGNLFLDLSIDMFCVAGFDGYFKRLNPAWEKSLGLKAEELLRKPYLDFIHPEDREATIAKASDLATGEAVMEFEKLPVQRRLIQMAIVERCFRYQANNYLRCRP